jgi:hypothetical protein
MNQDKRREGDGAILIKRSVGGRGIADGATMARGVVGCSWHRPIPVKTRERMIRRDVEAERTPEPRVGESV